MIPKFNTTSTSWLALGCVALSVAGIVVGYDQYADDVGFWLGFGGAVAFVIFLGASSYYNTRKRLSEQEVEAAKHTMHTLEVAKKTAWYWFMPIVLLAAYVGTVRQPVIYGVGIGAFSAMGLMVLADNWLLKRIFLWNLHDPRIRDMYKKRGL